MLVARIRGLYPEKGMGIATHNHRDYYSFYFSNHAPFTNNNGIVEFGKKKFSIPTESSYILFPKEAVVFPNEEGVKKGYKPRIEIWGTTESYYNALSKRFLQVIDTSGQKIYSGGIKAFRSFLESKALDTDDLEIHV